MTPGSGATASSPRARPLLLVLLGVLIVGMITLLATSASQQRPHSTAAPRTGGSLLGVGGDMLDLAVGDVEYGAGAGAAAGAAAAPAGGAKDEAYVPAKVRKPVDPMMSKMGNETLKAELGRSAWRLIHTMAGKFPYKPTQQQQETMLDFIYAFAQVYPCGECARHFKLVLEKYPPNVTDRESLSQWACKVHNVVNDRLKKPIFDCSKVGEMYKCGCTEEELDSLFAAMPTPPPS